MNLGQTILAHRNRLGWSQDRLAEALEVSRQSVSKWETGAAVPDLDKLMKMCDLFGVSLDQLVGREAPAEPPAPTAPAETTEPEPKIIYVEKPVLPAVNRNQIIGTVILLCAFLYALILYNGRFGLEETLFLVLPVALCGVVFLLTSHPLIYSGWLSAGGYWAYFFILFHRWEEHPFMILLGVVLVGGMALRTIQLRKRGVLPIPMWVMVSGGIVLLLLLILLCMNCMPLTEVFVTERSMTPIPSQGG